VALLRLARHTISVISVFEAAVGPNGFSMSSIASGKENRIHALYSKTDRYSYGYLSPIDH